MKPIPFSLLLLAVLTISVSAKEPLPPQTDWAQWRGPAFNGTAPGATPPATWSESQNVKWKFKIPGFGSSSPIVWKNQVFILTAIPSGKKVEAPTAPEPPEENQPGGRRRSEKPDETYQFVVISVDRETGKLLWQKTAKEILPHEGHHKDHGFASSSPVTDGQHLYVSFGSRGLFCFDLAGNLKWEKDLGDMQTRNSFGEGSSPALHGNTLVINWDHEGEDFIVAMDKNSGKELWRQKRDEPTNWSTPLIIKHDGVEQVIVSSTNRIRSYELSTGKVIWECGGMTTNVIPTPIADFGMVYALSGFRGAALLAIKLGGTGDLTDKPEAITWRHAKATPYVPSAVLSGERLYFFSGNMGILSCFNAKTGQPYYEAQRINELLGGVYASPVAAEGRVYLVGRDGKTVTIKDADQLEIIATNVLDDKFDASAAISGKSLFLRGHEHLYCIEESK